MRLKNGTTWEEFLQNNNESGVSIDTDGTVGQGGIWFTCGRIDKTDQIEAKTYYTGWE